MTRKHYGLAVLKRSAEHTAGHRHGVRAAVAWLHREADRMADHRARSILNAAAFRLGTEAAHAREGCRCHYDNKLSSECPVHGHLVGQLLEGEG